MLFVPTPTCKKWEWEYERKWKCTHYTRCTLILLGMYTQQLQHICTYVHISLSVALARTLKQNSDMHMYVRTVHTYVCTHLPMYWVRDCEYALLWFTAEVCAFFPCLDSGRRQEKARKMWHAHTDILYLHTYTHCHTYTCTHTHIVTHTCAHTHTHTHTHCHTHTHTHKQAHTHTHMHTHTHKHAHTTHTYKHTSTHKHTQTLRIFTWGRRKVTYSKRAVSDPQEHTEVHWTSWHTLSADPYLIHKVLPLFLVLLPHLLCFLQQANKTDLHSNSPKQRLQICQISKARVSWVNIRTY